MHNLFYVDKIPITEYHKTKTQPYLNSQWKIYFWSGIVSMLFF